MKLIQFFINIKNVGILFYLKNRYINVVIIMQCMDIIFQNNESMVGFSMNILLKLLKIKNMNGLGSIMIRYECLCIQHFKILTNKLL